MYDERGPSGRTEGFGALVGAVTSRSVMWSSFRLQERPSKGSKERFAAPPVTRRQDCARGGPGWSQKAVTSAKVLQPRRPAQFLGFRRQAGAQGRSRQAVAIGRAERRQHVRGWLAGRHLAIPHQQNPVGQAGDLAG